MKNNNSYVNTLQVIKKVVKYLTIFNRYYLLISFFNMVIQGVLPSIMLLLFQRIINVLQTKGCELNYLLKIVIIYCLCSLFSEWLVYIYTYYTNIVSAEFDKKISIEMMNKASNLNLKDFENPKTYDVINRAQSQNGATILSFASQCLEMIKSGVTLVSMFVLLIAYRWWMVIAVVLIPMIKCVVTIKIDNEWYKIKLERTERERKAWYIVFLFMTGNAHKEIMTLGIKKYLLRKCEKLKDYIIFQNKKIYKKSMLWAIVLEIGDAVASGGMCIYTLLQGYKGSILIGNVVTYLECIKNVQGNLNGLFSQISNIVQQSLYVDLFFQFMDLEENRKTGNLKINCIENIELVNVSYKYNDSENYAIKDISLKLCRGETIGIVGENGSGKSTLIKVILGFYDDYEGTILVNGINLRKIDKQSYISQIGVVFQDYIKFEGTIRENIGYGNLQLLNNDVEILKFVDEMKLNKTMNTYEKLDTCLGNWFGRQISGGEWQRLAVARAMIRKADFLILDEPDASIDINKQLELLNVYKNYLSKKMGVFISHKVSGIHYVVSKICVLENGQIIEEGTHNELLNKAGQYKEMYEKSRIIENG